MSWKPAIKTQGEDWSYNALRFATKEEALGAAKDIYQRWMLATDFDAHESDDPVNYKIVDNVLIPVKKEAA